MIRHIHVGLGPKVWCAEPLGTRRQQLDKIIQGRIAPPATEGDVLDERVPAKFLCPLCRESLLKVRVL